MSYFIDPALGQVALRRLRVPALIGGEAHGRVIDFPDPWPISYAPERLHEQTYVLFIAADPEHGWIEFFALRDATDAMREGQLASWRRQHPEWPAAA